MSAQWSADAGPRVSSDELSGWVRRVVDAAAAHDTSTSVVTYGGVRVQWLRRSLADIEARTVLATLCRAAGRRRSPRKEVG